MKTTLFRRFSVLSAALGVAASWAGPAQAQTNAWPAYRGPHGDGTSAETISLTSWPKAGPKAVWRQDTPLGFSSFTVADGRAYTLVGRSIDGVPTEVCVALDQATGNEVWAAHLKIAKYQGGGNDGEGDNKGGDGPRSTPTFAAGHIYVMGANLDLHCLRAADGGKVWSKDLSADHGGKNIAWSNAASPVVDDGVVYCAGGGEGESFLAFKADTGDVVWKAGSETMTHATPVTATIHGQRQIIFFVKSGLVSVEPKTGKELWRFAFPFRVSTAASPVVSGDLVYCAAGYSMGMGCARISKTDAGWSAEQLWRVEGDSVTNHWSTPVAKDGFLYGMFSFKKYGRGPLLCLEMATGEVKWSQEGFGAGNVIVAGPHIVALSDRGEIALIEARPDRYKELARADVLDGKCWSTPVLADGKIYARSTKEGVCLDVTKK